MLFLAIQLFVLCQKSKQKTEEKRKKKVYRSLAFNDIPSKSRRTKMDILAFSNFVISKFVYARNISSRRMVSFPHTHTNTLFPCRRLFWLFWWNGITCAVIFLFYLTFIFSYFHSHLIVIVFVLCSKLSSFRFDSIILKWKIADKTKSTKFCVYFVSSYLFVCLFQTIMFREFLFYLFMHKIGCNLIRFRSCVHKLCHMHQVL